MAEKSVRDPNEQLSEQNAKLMPVTTKRGIERRRKILEVAEKHFFANGYAGTSVNEIVKEAGGSLNTLYRYFSNKLGLFEAVMKDKTDELFSPFAHTDFWQADIESNLFNFGRALQQVALYGDGIAIYRLVATENNLEQGEIQKIFYQLGPQTAISLLGDYLQCQKESGQIEVIDSYFAAAQFLEMVKGPFFYPALFGETLETSRLEMALQQAVQIFLKGCLKS